MRKQIIKQNIVNTKIKYIDLIKSLNT